MESLKTNGYAVIPGVLNNDECDQFLNGVWDSFEHISKNWETPINRQDTKTWREFWKLYPMHSMLYQHWGLGHSQAIWNVRQNEKVLDVFSAIWECEKDQLISSFDGLSFHLPPEVTNRGWFRKHWFHTDQSYTNNKFTNVQGFVTANEIRDGDATLCVIKGSHDYHGEFGKTFNITKKDDWYKLSEAELSFYLDKGLEIERITCPRGSLVLWDSRTLHCGVEPIKGQRTEPNIRCISYVCYKPRKFATSKQLEKKRKAFSEGRMTTHDPIKSKLFGLKPQTYGSPIPDIVPLPKIELTDRILKLSGT